MILSTMFSKNKNLIVKGFVLLLTLFIAIFTVSSATNAQTFEINSATQSLNLVGLQDVIVTQEFRYSLPEAGQVFLVWGVDGWQTVPEEMRPPGTIAENGLMTTPMSRKGDTFVLKMEVPAGTTIDYVFQITRTRSGVGIEIWDTNTSNQNYKTTAISDGVVELQGAASVATHIIIRDITVVDLNSELLLFFIGICFILIVITGLLWFTRPKWLAEGWALRHHFVDPNSLKVAIVMVAIALTGLLVVDNYGMSWDEPLGFLRTWNNLDMITGGEVDSGDWRYYGVLFDGTSEFVFQSQAYFRRNVLDQVQDFYPTQYLSFLERMYVKHTITFLFSLIAYISVAGLVGLLCGWQYAWLGPIVLFLFPRFFGASFFNFKDIPFATMFILCSCVGAYVIGYYATLGNKIRIGINKVSLVTILYGVLLGLLTSVRIGGLVFIAFVGLTYIIVRLSKENIYNDLFRIITQARSDNSAQDLRSYLFNRDTVLEALNIGVIFGLMFATWFATVILFHPVSWTYPFGWLFEAVSYLSKHAWSFNVLFNGQYVSGQAVPWYYLPTWLAITIPAIFQLAFVIGLILFLIQYSEFSNAQRAAMSLLLLQIFFLPLVAIVKQSTVYDGMRQFLFMLPGIAVVSTFALVWLYKQLPKKNMQRAYATVVLLIFAVIGYDMIKLHPYEYIYFNRVFGGLPNAYDRYETDYWGLSLRKGMEWINENGQSNTVVVGGLLDAAKIFADPGFTFTSLKHGFDEAETRLVADFREKSNISESFYYLAVPKHGFQRAFPECDVVHQVMKQNVPLSIVKYCQIQPSTAQTTATSNTSALKGDITDRQATVAFDQKQETNSASDDLLVVQEIVYQLPDGYSVFLVWGINDWQPVSDEFRPDGTKIVDGVMYSPMVREGDVFKTKIEVPSDTTIDYVFQIIEANNNTEIWDTNEGQNYNTVVSDATPIQIDGNALLSSVQSPTTAQRLNLPLITSLGLIIIGLGTILIMRQTRTSSTTNLHYLFDANRIIYLRDLLHELVARDMKLRYKRSVLGIIWSLLNPLAQLLVFIFVFSVVLPLDIPNYSLFVFTGLLVWTWFQSALFQAADSIIANPDLIRRPGFPMPVLPVVTITTHLIHFLLAVPILMFFLWWNQRPVTLALLFFPILIALQFLLTLSLSYLMAALQVTFRDIQHLLGIVLTLTFYMTPIFYDASFIPDTYRWLYNLNPVVQLVSAYRAIFLYGEIPQLLPLLVLGVASLGLLHITYTIFMRTSYRFVEEL